MADTRERSDETPWSLSAQQMLRVEVGFDAHVTKPADIDKLAELITAAA